MTAHDKPPPPCAIVIFGANGDLTKRLIVPALYNLGQSGLLPPHFSLIGVDHNDRDSQDWAAGLHDFLQASLGKSGEGDLAKIDETKWQSLAKAMTFFKGDFTDDAMYAKLASFLAERDKSENLGGNVLFYLAVADRFFGIIA